MKSVEHGFYYMHPQNRFWKVLEILLEEPLYSVPISQRISTLNRRKIALYDSVEECDILGSSDSSISDIIPADLPSLIGPTHVAHIFCNGGAAYLYASKYHADLSPIMTKLPSTSPANAAYSLDRLCAEWKVILDWLD